MKGDTVQRMRILNYRIQSTINVKAEITKLTGFPIKNETDSFYLVVPTLISTLPGNVMFIQELFQTPAQPFLVTCHVLCTIWYKFWS